MSEEENSEIEELIENLEQSSINNPNTPKDYCGNIYMLTCKITNMSYIGQTRSHKFSNDKWYSYGVNGRWNDHLSESRCNLNKNNDILVAMREYNNVDNWEIVTLSNCKIDELDEKEAFYIEEYDTISPNGYNMTTGGRNSTTVSDKTRQRISEASTKNWEKDGFKEKLSKIQISVHELAKIKKIESKIDQIDRCLISLQKKGDGQKFSLRFYPINSITPIKFDKCNFIAYGGLHVTTDDTLKNIVQLFKSLTKTFTVEFKDKILKEKYDSFKRSTSIAGTSLEPSTTTLETSQDTRGNDLGHSKNVEDLIIRSEELQL